MRHRLLYTISKDRELSRKVMLLAGAMIACGLLFFKGQGARVAVRPALPPQAAAMLSSDIPVVQAPVRGDHVSGIVIDGNRSFAVINGRRMMAGDGVGDKVVVQIERRVVTLCLRTELSQCVQLRLEK